MMLSFRKTRRGTPIRFPLSALGLSAEVKSGIGEGWAWL